MLKEFFLGTATGFYRSIEKARLNIVFSLDSCQEVAIAMNLASRLAIQLAFVENNQDVDGEVGA
jgi:hypothetical protein